MSKMASPEGIWSSSLVAVLDNITSERASRNMATEQKEKALRATESEEPL